MSKKNRNNGAVETNFADEKEEQNMENQEAVKNEEAKKDETKKEKKENFIVKGFKKVGHGLVVAKDAVCDFVSDHPIAGMVGSGLAGAGILKGIEFISSKWSSDEAEPIEVDDEPLYLPDGEEEDSIEIPDEVPAEEVTE